MGMSKVPVAQRPPSRQGGLTLVELMISVLLGAFMSLGMAAVYLEAKRNYSMEDEMARIQENGRYTLNLLKRELNMAGLFGGKLQPDDVAAVAIDTDCAAGNWALDASEAIEFTNDHDAAGNPVTVNGTTLTCLTGSDIQPDTDILAIKRTAGEATLKSGAFAGNFNPSDQEQWFLRIVNFGDTMEWSKISSDQLEDPNGPYDPNDSETDLAYWESYAKVFYVRKYAEVAADGIPTLCVENLVGNDMVTNCLVEGIEEMHIEFGLDTDADGVVNRYTNAPTAAQMDDAAIARIYLLVRSSEELAGYQDQKSYQLGQRNIAAKNDGYMRRVFTTTVQVRNAILPAG